ncbi:prolyl 4-hydroxylase subunit alpha-1 [Stomoxys calcitrans]|uniref:prolyl 4-hydroxylase subunit alpha-1 n=1 Tax=Stomoxys calcitrans TaxID=35570 RepID=UPI0027E29C74|nr:prolyl 4-hydroxylase subunit alpha-1 [Stomoxys calcitrans]
MAYSSISSSSYPVRIICSFGFGLVGLLLVLLLAPTLHHQPRTFVSAEFYSSVDSLRQLDGIETLLLHSFRKYSKGLQDEISTLRRFMERIKFQHKKAQEDVEDYLGNPINAFTLIERMVSEWSDVGDLLKFEDSYKELTDSLTQLEENFTLPDEKELKGAVLGLARLQDTYGITTDAMANGKGYGLPLSWRECYELATVFRDESRTDLALEWLEQAYDKLQASKETKDVKTYFGVQIKETLALIHQVMGNVEKAAQHLDDILVDEPLHPTKLTKKILSRYSLETFEPYQQSETDRLHAQLCRGETTKKQNLSCYLESSSHPFLTLAPLQIEPLNLDPFIRLYHNVLNDRQIAELFNYAEGKMFRSRVLKTPGEGEVSEIRVCQQTWLSRFENPVAGMMYRLLHSITGFNITNVESMQLANYGIGGLYAPHHDFVRNYGLSSNLVGDRITTSMFYLTDVTEGGYTIFPEVGVFAKPTKGSMVMWPNLHKSLAPDVRTLHGGCPVLKGSKYIANIWSRSGFQDVAMPCGLVDDTFQRIDDLPE